MRHGRRPGGRDKWVTNLYIEKELNLSDDQIIRTGKDGSYR